MIQIMKHWLQFVFDICERSQTRDHLKKFVTGFPHILIALRSCCHPTSALGKWYLIGVPFEGGTFGGGTRPLSARRPEFSRFVSQKLSSFSTATPLPPPPVSRQAPLRSLHSAAPIHAAETGPPRDPGTAHHSVGFKNPREGYSKGGGQ